MERWRRLDLGQVGHSGQKFSIFLLQLDEKKLQERLNKRRLIFRKDEEEEEKFWKAKNLVDVNFFRGSGFEPLVPGNARHSNLRPYSSLPVLTVRYLDEIQHGEGFPGHRRAGRSTGRRASPATDPGFRLLAERGERPTFLGVGA